MEGRQKAGGEEGLRILGLRQLLLFDLTDEVLCILGGPKKKLRTKNGEKDLNLSIAPLGY